MIQGQKAAWLTKLYSLPVVIVMLLLTACSYQPVSRISRQTIAAPLYLKVRFSAKIPESSVILKDRLRQAIAHRLAVPLTDAADASSRLVVDFGKISYTPLGYDDNGYVERYRVTVTTLFDLQSRNRTIRREIRTSQEADVTPSALESSRAKEEAITSCTKKAVDQFVAFVAANAIKQSPGR